MNKLESKKHEFKTRASEAIGKELTIEESNHIFDIAFEMIQEGLVNSAINCTLDADMNSIYLNGLLTEAEWDNEAAVQKQNEAKTASNYLLNDWNAGDTMGSPDPTIHEAIKLIRNNPDQNQLIDFVDGVVVWEKVESEFTCKEFIELIS